MSKLETITTSDLKAVTGGALWTKKHGKLVKIPNSDVPKGAEDLLGGLGKLLKR